MKNLLFTFCYHLFKHFPSLKNASSDAWSKLYDEEMELQQTKIPPPEAPPLTIMHYDGEPGAEAQMDSAEYSSLLFLLDALQNAPNKAPKLLAMAEKTDASEPYKTAIINLRQFQHKRATLLGECAKMKREMR